jgi:hypothetical protein
MVKDNKIVTTDWQDYHKAVELITKKIDYDLSITKMEFITNAMKITEAMSYNIELKIASISIPRGNNDEQIDVRIYVICKDDNRFELCLRSTYLDVEYIDSMTVWKLREYAGWLACKIFNEPADVVTKKKKGSK